MSPVKSKRPFVSEQHRPATYDGIFRVLLVSTGSVASVKMPDIVRMLTKDPSISLQIVATRSSLHFYNQKAIDDAVRESDNPSPVAYDDPATMASPSDEDDAEIGLKIWTDEDEWSDWRKLGDPILHIELRRWADLVVLAPCSADMLAKIAAGLCDNLALSVLRALPSSTPVILCPAMNTHMYSHPFTAKHLKSVREELNYLILGPQGAGKLACGDEGPGKMTDWRDIVIMIQDFASMFRMQRQHQDRLGPRASDEPMPDTDSNSLPYDSSVSSSTTAASPYDSNSNSIINKKTAIEPPHQTIQSLWKTPGLPIVNPSAASQTGPAAKSVTLIPNTYPTSKDPIDHWKMMSGGKDGGKMYWEHRFWLG